jgi:hypothetical protein
VRRKREENTQTHKKTKQSKKRVNDDLHRRRAHVRVCVGVGVGREGRGCSTVGDAKSKAKKNTKQQC